MDDITRGLPELEHVRRWRSSGPQAYGDLTVEDYGDYTAILAQGPADILSTLNQVPANRRPAVTPRLRAMTDFYMSWGPEDTFVLGCFDESVAPGHPIAVSYKPRDPSVLTIPGLDGHDGRVPTPGKPVYRDFRVAFGAKSMALPHPVYYTDDSWVIDQPWAPRVVSGFVDNRKDGPNGDYIIPVEALRAGMTGRELAGALQSPLRER